jgi:hypothetical protein
VPLTAVRSVRAIFQPQPPPAQPPVATPPPAGTSSQPPPGSAPASPPAQPPASSQPPPPTGPTFTVVVSVTGPGTVTSTPSGIACPGTCTHAFPTGTIVTLEATPAPGSRFKRWGVACLVSLGRTCLLATSCDAEVTAKFERDDDLAFPPPK